MRVIFTLHALEKMERREIFEEEVFQVIRYPEKIKKRYGLYYFQKKLQRGLLEVCCERTASYINIITLYWI